MTLERCIRDRETEEEEESIGSYQEESRRVREEERSKWKEKRGRKRGRPSRRLLNLPPSPDLRALLQSDAIYRLLHPSLPLSFVVICGEKEEEEESRLNLMTDGRSERRKKEKKEKRK